MKKLQNFLTLTALLTTLTLPSLALAAEGTDARPYDPKYNGSTKFQRGVHNVATGWMDAPVTVDRFNRERNWFEALTTGVTRGVGLAIARTGVGIYETVTFPFEAPERFEPLMMPERV